MKELTHEEWMENPTPRIMWVWDDDACNKVKRKVIYVAEQDITYPVITLTKNEALDSRYRYCAEIEEPKSRRMTNKELSRWLRENPTRECKYGPDDVYAVFSYHSYVEREASEEVTEEILIRENNSEWREPLVEQ